MSSVAPPQDAIAANAPSKKKNKRAKKPKKNIDTHSKDGDSPSTTDQQPTPSPRDSNNSNNNHENTSAGDDDEPSTPVVSLKPRLRQGRRGPTSALWTRATFLHTYTTYTVVQYLNVHVYASPPPPHEAIFGHNAPGVPEIACFDVLGLAPTGEWPPGSNNVITTDGKQE